MVREELQREKLGYRVGKRAMKFEEKLSQGRGGELAQKCWKEIIDKGRRDGEMTAWEKERKYFYKDKGVDLREIGTDERIELDYDKIEGEAKKRQEEERWSKIIESKYNECYREIKTRGFGNILKRMGENRWRRIVRFRLGNEVRSGMYWETREKKVCRVCLWEEETWEYVWDGYVRGGDEVGSWQENKRKILGEEGEGEEWIKVLEKLRRSGEEKELNMRAW